MTSLLAETDEKNRRGPRWLGLRLAALVAALAAVVWLAQGGWLSAAGLDALAARIAQFREDLPNYGPLAPVVFIALYAAQIVAAPIPGHGLAFTAGYLFGPFAAAVYSLTGILVGGALAFGIGRRMGWPLIEKLAPRSWIERWRSLQTVNSTFTWFLLMLAPSTDVVYFIAGLTTLSLRRFLALVALGRSPGVIISSFLGANVEALGAQWMPLLILALLVLAAFGHVLRQRIQKKVAPSAPSA